mgnify:CR=1 FL=1|tara:strand:- start:390 stop:611 length:222 start_codon:yes stop_codon:yes gene_type:complete
MPKDLNFLCCIKSEVSSQIFENTQLYKVPDIWKICLMQGENGYIYQHTVINESDIIIIFMDNKYKRDSIIFSR